MFCGSSRIYSVNTHQIEQIHVGDSAHALVLHQCDDDECVPDHRQQEDDHIQGHDSFTDSTTCCVSSRPRHQRRAGRVLPVGTHVSQLCSCDCEFIGATRVRHRSHLSLVFPPLLQLCVHETSSRQLTNWLFNVEKSEK